MEDDINKKEPWGEGTPWKNSTAFFTYLRGCLRKAWSRHPTKLSLIKEKRKQIKNPNPKGKKETVWGAECSICNKDFVIKDIQVDHIHPAGSLTKTSDIQGFVERLLYITADDLRLVCKNCNSILAYADKHKVSFAQAAANKYAIKLQKEKKDKQWLKEKNIPPASNAKLRREQIVDCLKDYDGVYYEQET